MQWFLFFGFPFASNLFISLHFTLFVSLRMTWILQIVRSWVFMFTSTLCFGIGDLSPFYTQGRKGLNCYFLFFFFLLALLIFYPSIFFVSKWFSVVTCFILYFLIFWMPTIGLCFVIIKTYIKHLSYDILS
jgi:hypothetical protein